MGWKSEFPRDWSHAYDIIQELHLALSYEDTQDFILAMGEPHMVREFISVAFKVVGVNIVWKGSGLNEVGIEKRTNSIIVKVEPTLFLAFKVVGVNVVWKGCGLNEVGIEKK